MTTITIERTVNDEGVALTAFSDTMISSPFDGTYHTQKTFKGTNYVIGGAGNGAVSEFLRVWVENNPVIPNSLNRQYAAFRELVSELTAVSLMGDRKARLAGSCTVIVGTELGVYSINCGDVVRLADTASIGTGALKLVSIKTVIDELKVLGCITNADSALHAEMLTRMAINMDRLSDGFDILNVVVKNGAYDGKN